MDEADRTALSAFEAVGIEPEAALHRIRYEGPVDRATAAAWREEEIEEVTESRSVERGDATVAVDQVHETVSATYDRAAMRLRNAAPEDIAEDEEARRMVREEQREMEERARDVEETAKKSRRMRR